MGAGARRLSARSLREHWHAERQPTGEGKETRASYCMIEISNTSHEDRSTTSFGASRINQNIFSWHVSTCAIPVRIMETTRSAPLGSLVIGWFLKQENVMRPI